MIALAEPGPRDLPTRHPATSGFALALARRSQNARGRAKRGGGWEGGGCRGFGNPLRVPITMIALAEPGFARRSQSAEGLGTL
jgi:hypothetical protein